MLRFLLALGEAVILMALGLWVMSLLPNLLPAVTAGIIVVIGLVFLDLRETGKLLTNVVHHLVAGVLTAVLLFVAVNLAFPLAVLVLLAILIAVVVADLAAPYLPGYTAPHPATAH